MFGWCESSIADLCNWNILSAADLRGILRGSSSSTTINVTLCYALRMFGVTDVSRCCRNIARM